jgi:hypothetical protein
LLLDETRILVKNRNGMHIRHRRHTGAFSVWSDFIATLSPRHDTLAVEDTP